MWHATFLEVPNWIGEAWESVSPRIIISGFRKAEIMQKPEENHDESDSKDEDESDDEFLPDAITSFSERHQG